MSLSAQLERALHYPLADQLPEPGRAITLAPGVMLDEPTRGIDVGAKHEIYRVMYDLAEHGISILFASSDLPEALGLADRVVIMREGRIVGELLHDEATEQKALALAMLRQPAQTVEVA